MLFTEKFFLILFFLLLEVETLVSFRSNPDSTTFLPSTRQTDPFLYWGHYNGSRGSGSHDDSFTTNVFNLVDSPVKLNTRVKKTPEFFLLFTSNPFPYLLQLKVPPCKSLRNL